MTWGSYRKALMAEINGNMKNAEGSLQVENLSLLMNSGLTKLRLDQIRPKKKIKARSQMGIQTYEISG